MIKVERLEKRIGGAVILRDINFAVSSQSVLGVIGASGSGKTTLLRCLNGLERIDSGTIDCGGISLDAGLDKADYQQRVKELRRKIGTVFQHLYLFPHLTVLGNIVEAPIHVLGTARHEAQERAYELLDLVGLKQMAERFPESLSGGEQQRVAIVRALAMRPDVLLFDEPTSALDPRRSADLRKLLLSFVERGHTMIIVSHSIKFLEGLADYLLYMENGEAVEFGEAERILNAPADPRTREFMHQAQ